MAIQTYELVDKHIRRLDADLQRFEGEIQDKNPSGPPEENVAKSKILIELESFNCKFGLIFRSKL